MDFAAQLAKLERQAVNAVKKNSAAATTQSANTERGTYGDTSATTTTSSSNHNHHSDPNHPNHSGGNGEFDSRRRSRRDRSPYPNDSAGRSSSSYNHHNNNGDDRSTRRRYDHNSNNTYNSNHQRGAYHNQHQSRRFSPSHHPNNSNRNQNNKHHPFQELQQSGYRIRPSLPWVPKSDRTRPHICLLAIIIDELPYEHIWQAWANSMNHNNSGGSYVSLVCHAKYPKRVQSPWVRQRLLVQPPQMGRGGSVTANSSNSSTTTTSFADPMYRTHVPEWGSIHITCAMMDCLKDAVLIGTKKASEMHDVRFTPNRYVISEPYSTVSNTVGTTHSIPTVDKFIFISESCLPVMSLDEYVQLLFPPLEETTTSNTTTDTMTTTIQDNAPSKADTDSIEKVVNHENDDDDGPDPSATNVVESNTENSNVESKVSTTAETTAISSTHDVSTTKTDDAVVVVNSNTPLVDPWDVSWVNGRSRNTVGTPRNMYETNQFQNIDGRIPDTCRYKADQWILLSRRHAIHILHIDEHISHPQYQFWTLFQNISASDEMYFPTTLGILGLLKDDDLDQNNTSSTDATSKQDRVSQSPLTSPVWKRSVTYTDWSQGMRNPTSFTNGIRDFETVARLARQQQCLLARKFVVVPPSNGRTVHDDDHDNINSDPATKQNCTGQITVEEWRNVVHQLSGTF